MDTLPPEKSFESLLSRAREERFPEINVRDRVRQILAADRAPITLADTLAGLLTPLNVSFGLAALIVTFTVSGLQLMAALNLLEEVLVVRPLGWL